MKTLGIMTIVASLAFGAAARDAILFFNAHPDDTDGFAATAFLLREKYDLHVVDLTRGELGLGPKGLADGSTAYRRTQEETKAQAYLGAKIHFLFETDGFATAGERPVNDLARLLHEIKPRAVFTHWPIDNHVDHMQCQAILANALRRTGLKPERYFFEEWMRQTRNMTPTYYVDVTRTFANKKRMLSIYECQNDNGYLLEMTEKRARFRGSQRTPAVAFAEPFATWDGRPIKGGVLENLPETAIRPGAEQRDIAVETDLPPLAPALLANEIRFAGFYGTKGTSDGTTLTCRFEGGRFHFAFEVVDATPCAPNAADAAERALEAFDRVELFFSPTRDMSRPYCCAEIGLNGRVLDYRATYYRKMDYAWGFKTLAVEARATASGYAVKGSVALSELAAEGVDATSFYLGAFRADFAPGARLVDWFAAVPQGKGEADFHRPQLLVPVSQEKK